MLTGRRPWEGEGLFGVLQRQKRDDLPPVEAARDPALPAVPATMRTCSSASCRRRPARGGPTRRRRRAAHAHRCSRQTSRRGNAPTRDASRQRAAPPAGLGARGAAAVGAALTTLRLRRAPGEPPVVESPECPEDSTPTWAREERAATPARRLVLAGLLALGSVVAVLGVRTRDGADAAVLSVAGGETDRPRGVTVPVAEPAAPPPAAPDSRPRCRPRQRSRPRDAARRSRPRPPAPTTMPPPAAPAPALARPSPRLRGPSRRPCAWPELPAAARRDVAAADGRAAPRRPRRRSRTAVERLTVSFGAHHRRGRSAAILCAVMATARSPVGSPTRRPAGHRRPGGA
jgi:hypothetical protein